ncbi:MAG: hypothetical protein HLUCCX14_11795 [Marinobacter excellens HL-55]|uniref:Uncharacterized protein n=1 Tax=Marinobacter excellens HL-55 TaxID=1305731 RepID=A0A0P7ZFM5_9GAMM|nr:MAG: hypothetical protein HLUCCX14_11795 [Marinobacter excellens HL-55]
MIGSIQALSRYLGEGATELTAAVSAESSQAIDAISRSLEGYAMEIEQQTGGFRV